MMNGGANSDSIPMDLIPEILSRLPAKSIARFRCVSKPWKSITYREDFTKLFNTMSLSNPRLLIGVKQGGEWIFFSSPQPQNHYGKSSLVVAADFHTKFSEDSYMGSFSYASGLFYFPKRLSKTWEVRLIRSMGHYATSEEYEEVCAICNPSTGQYSILPPDLKSTYRNRCGLLGFDPIGKQFKVLKERVDDAMVYEILTLGTKKLRWRKIKCPSIYVPFSHGICINGVLYYKSYYNWISNRIGCFNVRSEKFKFLDTYPDGIGCFENLINYKGKLCGSHLEYGDDGGFPLKLRMWVLEDVEKEEWSAYAYTLSAENEVVKVYYDLSVVGVTASGELFLAKDNANKPFYVFYFNPDTNTLLSVEIQGVRKEEEWSPCHSVNCFVDHVENLNFDVMKTPYAATSSRPPRQRTSTSSKNDRRRCTFESANKFDALSFVDYVEDFSVNDAMQLAQDKPFTTRSK